MYNPLATITPGLMNALLQEPKLIVRQHYPRGNSGNDTIPLLLTYYYKNNNIDVNRANLHLKQLQEDKYRFLYDTENEEHRKKLLVAAEQPQGYRVFINLVPARWQPSITLRKKIHAYVQKNYEKKNSKTRKINVQLQDLYGKIYLLLSWKENKAEVLLDEVENTDPYVL